MKSFLLKITILAAVLTALFWKVDVADMWQASKSLLTVNLGLVAIIFCVVAIVYVIRWHLLLLKKVSFSGAFESVFLAQLSGFVLPARLSELVRVTYLKKIYRVPLSISTTSVIIEAACDVGIFSALTLVTPSLFRGMVMPYLSQFWGILLAVITLSLIGIFILEKTQFYQNSRFRRALIDAKTHVQKSLSVGLSLKLLLINLALWAGYFFSYFLFFKICTPFHLSFAQIVAVFVLGTVLICLPITPMAIGTFDSGLVLFLGTLGISKSSAIPAVTILHFLSLLPPLVFGSAVIIYKRFSITAFIKHDVLPSLKRKQLTQ